jgi:Transposase, Mutator family
LRYWRGGGLPEPDTGVTPSKIKWRCRLGEAQTRPGLEHAAVGFFNDPRVHFMRNVLAHAGRQGRRVVAAFIGTTFVQDDAKAASKQWRAVADQSQSGEARCLDG